MYYVGRREKQKINKWIEVLTEEEKVLLHDMSVKLLELSEEEWKVIIGNHGFMDLTEFFHTWINRRTSW